MRASRKPANDDVSKEANGKTSPDKIGEGWRLGVKMSCGGIRAEKQEPSWSPPSSREERHGFARMLSFWKLMGPLILRYKIVRGLPKGPQRDVELERLHDKYAPLVLQNILGLRGLYIKLGQAISVAPVAPDQYRETLAVLQNGVPPKPPSEVRRIIEAGLGRSCDELFRRLDDNPIGSASIGQVHRAELHDGRTVVVKIQYPEVKASFASDLAQLQSAARMWSPAVLGEVKELVHHFNAELSFEREALMMDTVATNLEAARFSRVAVPRSIPGMVSDMVLVMTYLPGTTLLDGAKAMAQAHADLLGVTVETLGRAVKEHAGGGAASLDDMEDEEAAEAAAEEDTTIGGRLAGKASAAAGEAKRLARGAKDAARARARQVRTKAKDATNQAIDAAMDAASKAGAALTGKAKSEGLADDDAKTPTAASAAASAAATPPPPIGSATAAEEEGAAPEALPSLAQIGMVHALLRCKRALMPCGGGPVMFDTVEVTRQLVAAYGQQIFLDGVFGADPHPGNLLLLPDGRLGMIDFGMTKELTDEERLTLSRSLIAVVENNEEELLALAKEAGLKSKYNRPATLIFFVKFAWGAYASGDEAEAAYKADPIIQSAGGLTLVRRVVFMLRGLCQVLGCPVDLVRTWEPVARKVLNRPRRGRCCSSNGMGPLGPKLPVHRAPL